MRNLLIAGIMLLSAFIGMESFANNTALSSNGTNVVLIKQSGSTTHIKFNDISTNPPVAYDVAPDPSPWIGSPEINSCCISGNGSNVAFAYKIPGDQIEYFSIFGKNVSDPATMPTYLTTDADVVNGVAIDKTGDVAVMAYKSTAESFIEVLELKTDDSIKIDGDIRALDISGDGHKVAVVYDFEPESSSSSEWLQVINLQNGTSNRCKITESEITNISLNYDGSEAIIQNDNGTDGVVIIDDQGMPHSETEIMPSSTLCAISGDRNNGNTLASLAATSQGNQVNVTGNNTLTYSLVNFVPTAISLSDDGGILYLYDGNTVKTVSCTS